MAHSHTHVCLPYLHSYLAWNFPVQQSQVCCQTDGWDSWQRCRSPDIPAVYCTSVGCTGMPCVNLDMYINALTMWCTNSRPLSNMMVECCSLAKCTHDYKQYSPSCAVWYSDLDIVLVSCQIAGICISMTLCLCGLKRMQVVHRDLCACTATELLHTYSSHHVLRRLLQGESRYTHSKRIAYEPEQARQIRYSADSVRPVCGWPFCQNSFVTVMNSSISFASNPVDALLVPSACTGAFLVVVPCRSPYSQMAVQHSSKVLGSPRRCISEISIISCTA